MRKRILAILMAGMMVFNSESIVTFAMNSNVNAVETQQTSESNTVSDMVVENSEGESESETGVETAASTVSEEVEDKSEVQSTEQNETVSETVVESEATSESIIENETEAITESATVVETETETVTESEAISETETITESTTIVETETETVTESATIIETETETETETISDEIEVAGTEQTFGDYEFTLSDSNDATISGYNGSETQITIPDKLDGYPVVAVGRRAFYGNKTITSVVIPNSVITIDDSAFYDCTSLSSVTLSSKLVFLGYQAFYNAPIESVTLPKTVETIEGKVFTKVKELIFEEGMTKIPEYACMSATEVQSITIPNSVEEIGQDAFNGCTSLSSITFGNRVETIGQDAFNGCKSITSVTFPDSVKTVGYRAFYGCVGITSVTLGKVESIGERCFYNVPIEKLTLPKTLTTVGSESFTKVKELIFEEGMTKIPEYACTSATEVESITIPNSVEEIGKNAFYGSTSIKSVTFGSNLKTIGQYAFYNCKSLTSVAFPDSIKAIGNSAFYGCVGITSVTLGNVESIGQRCFYNVPIEKLTLPKTLTTVGGESFTKVKELIFEEGMTKIPEYACMSATEVESITIPDSVEEIGNNAFYGSTSIKSVTFGSNLKTIGQYAFYNCKSLTDIVLSDDISIASNAFNNCVGLKSVVLGNNAVIGDRAFYKCTSLESLTVGENAVFGENSFAYCTAIKNISIGANPTFDEDVFYKVELGGSCTDSISWKLNIDNSELVLSGSGEMPDFAADKEAPWKGLNSFITTITISEDITSIGAYAFQDCESIKSLIVKGNIKKIGEYAFYSCDNLGYIEFANGISSIGAYAFSECKKVTDILFCGDAPTLNEESLPNYETVTAYYPETGAGWIDRLFKKFSKITWCVWDNTIPSNDIVLVLDTSGSMSGQMDELKESVAAFINGIGGRLNNTRIAVVEYNSYARVVTEFSTDNQVLINEVNKLTSGGGTYYVSGLNCADSILKQSNADFRSIVLFSDGAPSDSLESIVSVADKLREKYAIYTVGLYASDYQKNVLVSVAGSESNYFEADNIEGLLQAFLKLIYDFGKTEYTTVELKRHDKRYDILKEEHAFCVNSPEVVSLYVTPGTKYDNVSSIVIQQNGKEILDSSTGEFENIVPGTLFTAGEKIYAVLYDSKGNELESLVLLITMRKEFVITYNLNDDNNTIYKTETIVNGNDIVEPEPPTRDGFEFKGWYSSKECTGYTFFNDTNKHIRENIEDDITLYAKWENDANTFVIADDAWSFKNNDNPFYCTTKEISSGDYDLLTKNLDDSTRQAVEDYKNKKWNGSCFGMSSAAALIKAEVISLMQFDARYTLPGQVTTLYHNTNGDLDVGSIESMINYYHLRQKIGNILSHRLNYVGNESVNIERVINKLSSTKEPIVLTINLLKNGSIEGGHAVVAYGLKQDAANNTYSFNVYDCSKGNGYSDGKEYTVDITNNGSGYTKSCAEWEKAWGYGIFFKSGLTTEDLQEEDILTAPGIIASSQQSNSASSTYIMYTGYGDFTISDGTNSATIKGGLKESGNLDITCYGLISELGDSPEYQYVLPALADGSSYTITSTGTGNLNMNILYSDAVKGFYSSVNAANGGKITISSTGSISTKFAEKTAQTIHYTCNAITTPWYNIAITGEDTGFNVKSDNNKLIVTSDNAVNVNIKLNDRFNNVNFENIAVDPTGISVEEGSNGECNIVKDGNIIATNGFGYSVVFNSQCGTPVETLVNVADGSTIAEPEDPQRDGYVFEGWFKEKECINLWNFDTDKVIENTVLYAGWSVNENYFVTVTFKVPGCSNQAIYLANGSQLEKEKCPVITTNEDITWYKDDQYTKAWDFINDVVTQNTVLYGKGKNCKVSYVTNCATTIESFVTYAGKYITEPDVLLEKEGYTLCGWTTNSADGEHWDFDTTKVMDDTVLYARWVANERDKNGNDTKICIDILNANSYVYTGKAITPKVVVRDGNAILKQGKDYKLTFKNNINACDAESTSVTDNKKPQVIIQGINTYKSNKKFVKNFSIKQMNMADVDVTVDANIAAKPGNKLQQVKPVVKTANITVPAKNYVVNYYTDASCSNKVAGITTVGVYYIEVEAKADNGGNYYGKSAPIQVKVVSKDLLLSNAKLTTNNNVKCNMSGADTDSDTVIRSLISNLKLGDTEYKTDGTNLDTFKQYFIVNAVDANGVNISQAKLSKVLDTTGTKTITVIAKDGNDKGYVGSKSFKITVSGQKINKNQFKLTFDEKASKAVTSATYTGKALVPSIISNLELDRDYTVSYQYNKKEIGKSRVVSAGTYTAVIKGINKYSGTVSIKFKINGINLATAYADGKLSISSNDSAVYSSSGASIEYSISYDADGTGNRYQSVMLSEGKDYKLTFKNNKKVTTSKAYAFAIVNGVGNFSGAIKGDGKPTVSGQKMKAGIAKELNFTIAKKQLSSADIKVVVNSIKYKNNRVKSVNFTLYDNGRKVASKEYRGSSYTYGDQINLYIYARGKNYAGNKSVTMASNLIKTSNPKHVKITYKEKQKYFYSGTQITPEVVITNASGDDISSNFTVTYGENTKVGIGTVTITGKLENGYCAEKTLKFTILPKWMQWIF